LFARTQVAFFASPIKKIVQFFRRLLSKLKNNINNCDHQAWLSFEYNGQKLLAGTWQALGRILIWKIEGKVDKILMMTFASRTIFY